MVNKKITVITPFFNEEHGIELFHKKLSAVFCKLPNIDFEVLCIDDGSQDQTLPRLLDVQIKDPRFEIIELSRNFGKEAALTAGLNSASGDAVIPMDADLQDPPELIIEMIEKWQEGAEVVLAKRADRASDSFLKRRTAELFYRFHNQLSPIKIPENVGDYRLLDKVVVNAIKTLPESQRFMKGLFAWVGFKTVTIEYKRPERATGKSKFSGWKLWNFAIEGITSFSISPLRMWTYIGISGAAFAFLYAGFIIIKTLTTGIEVPGYASLLVAVLFFGSLQLISIGILGEYMGRTYMESKRRPLYLVRNHHRGKK